MAIKKLLRKDLIEGQLYYCRRKYYKKDYLIIWNLGPNYTSKSKHDTEVDYIQMNKQGTFLLVEIIKDEILKNVYWYKVLTSFGSVGYFFLSDEDFDILKLYFVKQSK
jgi:hypothetical protein